MLKDFKINHKSVIDSYYSLGEERNKELFLLISLLHINGFINNQSLNSLFNLLRKNKLYRQVNTYHSRINDKWYNDDSIIEIYEDVFDSMIHPKNKNVLLKLERINKLRKIDNLPPKVYKEYLTFEEVLKYLNRYLNKTRNYCIDYLFYEFIAPNIRTEYREHVLNSMFNYDFSKLNEKYSVSDYGYCCEDCDGPYEDYMSYRYSQKSDYVKKEINKMVNVFLNEKREKYKGSYKEYDADRRYF